MDGDAAILFLDNSPEKIKQVHSHCSSADTILVKETPESRVVKLLEGIGLSLKGVPLMPASALVSLPKEGVVPLMPASALVSLPKEGMVPSELQSAKLPLMGVSWTPLLRMRYKSAINGRTVARIKEWVEQHSAQHKYVLFDWGRTLTQLEGVRLTPMKVANYERILEFVCGGAKRVQLLRNMFQYLHESGCSIYMLTNNKHCGAATYRGLVGALAKVPLQFICSGTGSAAGHKGVAMQQHRTFRKFCKGKGKRHQFKSATGVRTRHQTRKRTHK